MNKDIEKIIKNKLIILRISLKFNWYKCKINISKIRLVFLRSGYIGFIVIYNSYFCLYCIICKVYLKVVVMRVRVGR